MDKYREDRELLIKAFEEAISNQFDKVIAESTATSECSEQHKARMKAIIDEANAAQAKCINRTKLIAALVAAALLLTGCTLYVLRNKIKCFIEYIYGTHVCVASEDEIVTGKITKFYKLYYVPEGYEMVHERVSVAQVFYRWENSDGKRIQFIQEPLEGKFFIDIDKGYTKIVEHRGIIVYHRQSERAYNYAWCDEENCFSLVSYVELSREELVKILDGLVVE